MAKGGGDAPDVIGAAKETGLQAQKLNEAQTVANRPNQQNAWGSTGWQATPVWDPRSGQYVNQWTQTETLNPLLQQQFDSQQRIGAGRSQLAEAQMGRVWDTMQSPMDFNQFGGPQQLGPTAPVGRFEFGGPSIDQFNYDVGGQRQKAEDMAYQKYASRLDPQFSRQEQELTTRLRNQGLAPGDQAYDAAMSNFNQSKNDAYQQAQYAASQAGRDESNLMFGQALGTQQQRVGEQGQIFGQALQGAGVNAQMQGQEFGQQVTQNQLANALRSQSIQEALASRNYNLDELNRLLAGQMVSGGPPTSGGSSTSTIGGSLLQGG